MKFTQYIIDKINYIITFFIYLIIIIFFMAAMEVTNNVIIILVGITISFALVSFLIGFYLKNNMFKNINNILDELDEKYLLSEIIKKPKREEKIAYYNILKTVSKSMLENVTNIRKEQQDYREYIESWIHEIKIPITSSKLLCENNKSEITNKIDKDIEEINNYVEQALFYARSDEVSNDFLVKKIKLNDIVKNVILRNKKIMIQNKMKVSVENVDLYCYSDEKWLEFILNQLIINSIKYRKKENSEISITSEKNKNNVKLIIKDNGIGIKESEIDRIFDKGFTGTNGRHEKKSTGIGLYLCHKLCRKLTMNIEVESIENEYTKMIITIPLDKKISEK